MIIVVGYTRTPEGRAALERAADEALLRDADLVVLHSMKGGTRDEEEEAATYSDEFRTVEQQLGARGVRHRTRELARGRSPSEDVVDVANEVGADLIVIGLRRRSPVGKLVLGSNAQDILLAAQCPVLAVKAPADAG